MKNYESVISDYIKEHNLTTENIDNTLKNIGYVTFFNEITIKCLGKTKTLSVSALKNKTSSLIYLPDNVKEKHIENFDILCVTNLYLGVMSNKQIKFNYKNYADFLEDLYILRKRIKQTLISEHNDIQIIKVQLLKIYMNIIYGIINNSDSVLYADNNIRHYIVEQTKNVVLKTVSFFINKSCPIYYIDTDEIYVPHITDSQFNELKQYFRDTTSEYTNTTVSDISVDLNASNLSCYIINKKKMIRGNDIIFEGIEKADNDKILIQNKHYFGRNYKDIFPEYSIW